MAQCAECAEAGARFIARVLVTFKPIRRRAGAGLLNRNFQFGS
jgi:hypothetical protein